MAFLRAISLRDKRLKIEIKHHNLGGLPFHLNIQHKPLDA